MLPSEQWGGGGTRPAVAAQCTAAAQQWSGVPHPMPGVQAQQWPSAARPAAGVAQVQWAASLPARQPDAGSAPAAQFAAAQQQHQPSVLRQVASASSIRQTDTSAQRTPLSAQWAGSQSAPDPWAAPAVQQQPQQQQRSLPQPARQEAGWGWGAVQQQQQQQPQQQQQQQQPVHDPWSGGPRPVVPSPVRGVLPSLLDRDSQERRPPTRGDDRRPPQASPPRGQSSRYDWEDNNDQQRRYDDPRDEGADWRGKGSRDRKGGGKGDEWRRGDRGDDWKGGGKGDDRDWKGGGKGDEWRRGDRDRGDDWKGGGKGEDRDWKGGGKGGEWRRGDRDDWSGGGKGDDRDWKGGGKGDDWRRGDRDHGDDWRGGKGEEWRRGWDWREDRGDRGWGRRKGGWDDHSGQRWHDDGPGRWRSKGGQWDSAGRDYDDRWRDEHWDEPHGKGGRRRGDWEEDRPRHRKGDWDDRRAEREDRRAARRQNAPDGDDDDIPTRRSPRGAKGKRSGEVRGGWLNAPGGGGRDEGKGKGKKGGDGDKVKVEVSGVPGAWTWREVKRMLQTVGEASDVRSKDDGKAFVGFMRPRDADAAVKALNGTVPKACTEKVTVTVFGKAGKDKDGKKRDKKADKADKSHDGTESDAAAAKLAAAIDTDVLYSILKSQEGKGGVSMHLLGRLYAGCSGGRRTLDTRRHAYGLVKKALSALDEVSLWENRRGKVVVTTEDDVLPYPKSLYHTEVTTEYPSTLKIPIQALVEAERVKVADAEPPQQQHEPSPPPLPYPQCLYDVARD